MLNSYKSLGEHKVVLLTDTHFGCRKSSEFFHNYFQKFYENTFFPYLDHHNIERVIHLGDIFDVRKNIDYWSLDWARRVFFDPLRERGIHLDLIVGNHDSYYKDSLKLNSPRMNLREYNNINIIDEPQTIGNICFVPWICPDNAEETLQEVTKSDGRWCMGHLELTGFYANKDYKCDHGTDPDYFSKFEKVFSGHFHKKSTKGNITYLGNPYQLYWNDEGEQRGFHVFDTDTGELDFIPNPNSMFHKIYLNSDSDIDSSIYEDKFTKIIVGDNVKPVTIHNLVENLYDHKVHEVKVVENPNLIAIEEEVDVEVEDTMSLLTGCVNNLESNLNKNNLIEIFKTLYTEAQEV